MPDLVDSSAEASAWMDLMLARHAGGEVFGDVRPAVIWTDDTSADGELLLPIDPVALATSINAEHYPLLVGHDPGRPMGKMLAAEAFECPTGKRFVAAVLGFYDGAPRVAFRDLGVDLLAPAPLPERLPPLPNNFGVQLAADLREVDRTWVDSLIDEAPFPVTFDARSYNAAEAPHAFVSIGVVFVGLVWNPFAKAFMEAAAKDAYAALHSWLKRLFERMTEQRNPFLEIQSFQQDCGISFLVRGRDVAKHYKAHQALADAAVRAAQLIAKLNEAGLPPVRLVYEFDFAAELWFPAFAELSDGRLVTDNADLIAAEQIPTGLSLGLSIKSLEKAPVAKEVEAERRRAHS